MKKHGFSERLINYKKSLFLKSFFYNLLYLLSLSLFFHSCNEQNNSATDSKPNIIIIYADDVGYGDISVYGSELIQTPNIDQLAEEGIRFTDAYATSAMCTPSRYSLLTRLYAFRLPSAGILSAEDPLLIEPGSTTLPSVLKQAGYQTSIFGKWHLGLGSEVGGLDWNGQIEPGPLEVGFDESFCFLLPTTGFPRSM